MSLGALAVRHDAASAALVRRSISDDLTARGIDPDSVDDVVLVASELVGNAVLHGAAIAGDGLDVDWDVEPDAVVVRVRDGSTTPPRRRPLNAAAGGGRGLAIVGALARDWGVQPTAHGKQVWARVPINHR
ncbi:MAG TPA: ATP-binding protein [Jatrophihabitans sp.]|nr:ATP-binding protein [Jatrophihabitans sp.]